ncbi:MAG: hypothetical protein JJU10_03585 [Idiomarina sp.]|nr:hypothetical protein [Idiomarina sp.]
MLNLLRPRRYRLWHQRNVRQSALLMVLMCIALSLFLFNPGYTSLYNPFYNPLHSQENSQEHNQENSHQATLAGEAAPMTPALPIEAPDDTTTEARHTSAQLHESSKTPALAVEIPRDPCIHLTFTSPKLSAVQWRTELTLVQIEVMSGEHLTLYQGEEFMATGWLFLQADTTAVWWRHQPSGCTYRQPLYGLLEEP